MNIQAVNSPFYSKADDSEITCSIVCEKGTLPFTATPHDPMDYGRQLYADLVAGKYGAITAYGENNG